MYPDGVSKGFDLVRRGNIGVQMKGNEVYKVAVNTLGQLVTETLSANDIPKSQLDWLIPHQANLRIIEAIARRLDLPMERVIVTIADHGNTSAASVPLALDTGIRDGRVKRGQLLLLEAFGGGFTWGSALIRYCEPRSKRRRPERGSQKKRRGIAAALYARSLSNYFETDFLNMRSIFSLICSMACEFCWAVERA